jgi:polyhydroxyalkanoate synthesis regulator phasin
MKVLEKNQTKILETEKLLRDVITTPNEFKNDEELLKALKTQSGIAKYQNEERNITSCSLNTVKSISEALLERGFLSLDTLRINAKSAIEDELQNEKSSKSNRPTKADLEFQIKELKLELDAVRRSNSLLTAMVSELRSRLKQLAQHEGTIEERLELYREHNRKIEAQMNFTLNGEL